MNSSEGRRNGAVMLYLLLLAAYFMSNFFRISPAVLLPRLAREMGMTAAVTGFISSLFFYAYGGVQPLCGALNDRYGPMRTGALGMALCALGTFMFSFADSPASLGIARLLTGLGLGPIFSGVLVHQAHGFPKERYAALTGITIAVGNLGAVISVAPLGMSLDKLGRFNTFIILGTISLAVAAAMWLCRSRDLVVGQSPRGTSMLKGLKDGMALLLKGHRGIKAATLMWASTVGLQISLQGLWAVAWFEEAYRCGTGPARNWATLIGVGMMAGTLLGGRLASLARGRTWVLASFGGAIAASWALFLAVMHLKAPLPLAGAAGALIGVTSGVGVVAANSAINDLVDRDRIGALIGAANMTVFAFVILSQWGSGVLIEAFGGQSSLGFLKTYGALTTLLTLCMLPILTVKSFRR
ncbi:arabinose efflux permease family protein [Thermanaerovibrio velox DSM 12556]|uniref:Arabinose efflux permease family protein n=1 Tax=Thermanaerovibrio velox DSM 12556 TaxID=926567 RepID=H0UQR0_9BACT|nr:arabinose efflux permease family protein [Thermanaerovibrio velox DSM 12556]